MSDAAEVSRYRVNAALKDAFGPHIMRVLETRNLTDLMLNEDGRLWGDFIGDGRREVGFMTPASAERALRLIASHNLAGKRLTAETPILSGTLPETGERIAGAIPPVTRNPTFSIRKPPPDVFNLEDFRDAKRDNFDYENAIRSAIADRRNIFIAASTGGGKTSLLSALLKDPNVINERCIIVEDTQEIALSSPTFMRMLTTETVDLHNLIKLCLRSNPQRIIVGEIRGGPAAMEMVDALNTGHQGSFCTEHANSAIDAIYRVEDLCARVCERPPIRAVAGAVGCVIYMKKNAETGRREIKEVIYVDGIRGDGQYNTTNMMG